MQWQLKLGFVTLTLGLMGTGNTKLSFHFSKGNTCQRLAVSCAFSHSMQPHKHKMLRSTQDPLTA